jgi:ribosomal protein S18 acetylase RimI-like enzyme
VSLVRDARLEELPALAAACAEQPLLRRYGTQAEKLARQLAGAIARGEQVIVVEEEGAARGFAWFLTSGTFANGGYLRLISLAPGAESRGLGEALMDEVERRVTGPHMFLLVSHWNQGARAFYARRGYRECGALPGFVLEDTEEIICWKRLR